MLMQAPMMILYNKVRKVLLATVLGDTHLICPINLPCFLNTSVQVLYRPEPNVLCFENATVFASIVLGIEGHSQA